MPNRIQMAFGGGPEQEGELTEVGVLRHDHEPVRARVVPDLPVRCGVQPELGHVAAVGELDREHADQSS